MKPYRTRNEGKTQMNNKGKTQFYQLFGENKNEAEHTNYKIFEILFLLLSINEIQKQNENHTMYSIKLSIPLNLGFHISPSEPIYNN